MQQLRDDEVRELIVDRAPRKMIRSFSSREKMSNSRSPRAVRSMTMGTRGITPPR